MYLQPLANDLSFLVDFVLHSACQFSKPHTCFVNLAFTAGSYGSGYRPRMQASLMTTRPRRILSLLALITLVFGAGSVRAADTGNIIGVAVDHARILEIDRPAATVIVGNPAIVDIEVLSSERLVLTGKNYGITNVVILDASGDTILDEQVAVQTFEASTVRVYRQANRITYALSLIHI